MSARAENTPLDHADDRAWLIFVEFQWELRQGLLQAINYLSKVRRQYIPPEVYMDEQSVGPMIIDSHSCPLNWEDSSTLVGGIDPIRQVEVTAFHPRRKPSDKQDPVLVNVPTGASNTSPLYSSTINYRCMVPGVHTASDGASTCNIEPDTYMAACLDSSIVKIESEHSRGPPFLACLDHSLLLVSHSEQYSAAIKREDVKMDNWLWPHHGLSSDAIEEEEVEFNHFDQSQQTFLIDRPKIPLPYFPPIWAQVGSFLFWRFTNPEIWRHHSLVRRYASLLVGLEVIKAAYIILAKS